LAVAVTETESMKTERSPSGESFSKRSVAVSWRAVKMAE